MKLLLLAFVALIVLANAQTSSLFDDFRTFSTVDANEVEPTETQVVDAANILGGRRSLTVTRTAGDNNALEASCTIVGGFFALSTDVSVIGDCVASYDGPTGAGFAPVDYNAFGCDCWNLRIIESDNNVGFAITATSDSLGPQTSSFMLALDINDPIDVCIPFGGDRAGYSDVTNVDFAISGLVANVDVNLQSVCCQPAVTCVHTIDALNGADIDNLVVGDTIKLSIECRNYESRPADLQEITVAFPFDDNFGIMDAGSVMCDGDVAPDTQGVTDNTLDFTASLVDTESIRCMVNVDLVGSGSVDNIAALISTSQGDARFPFQSNFNVDRQGTLEFCELPTPASLQIIDPPTTLPPTTEPPTTEPPTTEPPTTEPPTTEPPTTEPPTTEPPTTAPPTTEPPTTEPPTTEPPTTEPPTTEPPTTEPPTTEPPTTEPPTTEPPTTEPPTTMSPSTLPPTTEPPTTEPPTTEPPTTEPPTTEPPTTEPPTTEPPTTEPPTTEPPTTEPPTTEPPTTEPPTTEPPTTEPPTTEPPTTEPPTTEPPTTEPPTTEPPTTEPPTTQPPTTLPPTTEPPTPPRTVCVAPRIIDGMCDCQTFPCFEADDGSNAFRCETDEWYCWFVITVPASGRFRVAYRGQMCYCTL